MTRQRSQMLEASSSGGGGGGGGLLQSMVDEVQGVVAGSSSSRRKGKRRATWEPFHEDHDLEAAYLSSNEVEEQQDAMDELKRAFAESRALRPTDYESDRPVFLSVDS